jgi:chromosome segregation protein
MEARLNALQRGAAEVGGEAIDDQLKAQQEELAALNRELQPARERQNASRLALQRLEAEMARQRAMDLDDERRYAESRVALTQHENQVQNLRERISNDLGLVDLPYEDGQAGQSPLPIDGVAEQLPAVAELPEDLESSIQRYRGQLHRMGAINPEARAEYEETRGRVDFLSQQLEDLTAAREQLRGVLEELDRQTSQAFGAVVKEVDVAFGRTFGRLFGGGAAQLILTDPDDLTLSGVEIVARLPNRREQSLALLSGGERSLTAAALIFALLTVSPTPFCILDEVDAMLDEANVNRFRELLAELSHHTQFVVITHNRGTVQAAETIYGVSMGADSASQVLSVRPEEYLEQTAD